MTPMRPRVSRGRCVSAWMLLCCIGLAACDPDPNMKIQPRINPLSASAFFPNGAGARPRIEGTVTRAPTPWESDEPGAPQPRSPVVTLELLQHGRERFDIFCSPCHGRDGYAQGMIVQRGFPPPPSLHEAPIRALTDDHYYKVITLGLGKMRPYRDQVPPADRNAIIAYIRALQLSQDAPPSALSRAPDEQRSAPAHAASSVQSSRGSP